MTDPHIDVVRRGLAAWRRGDLDGLLAVLDADIVWHNQAAIPDAGVHRGHAEVRRHLEAWRAAWEELTYEIEDVVEAPDRLLVVWRRRGRGLASGAPVDDRVAHLYTFRAEKIVRFEAYSDVAHAKTLLG